MKGRAKAQADAEAAQDREMRSHWRGGPLPRTFGQIWRDSIYPVVRFVVIAAVVLYGLAQCQQEADHPSVNPSYDMSGGYP